MTAQNYPNWSRLPGAQKYLPASAGWLPFRDHPELLLGTRTGISKQWCHKKIATCPQTGQNFCGFHMRHDAPSAPGSQSHTLIGHPHCTTNGPMVAHPSRGVPNFIAMVFCSSDPQPVRCIHCKVWQGGHGYFCAGRHFSCHSIEFVVRLHGIVGGEWLCGQSGQGCT